MDLGLAGKRVLVTGSTKGLGRAVAEVMVAEGASVAIGARTASDVDAAVAELSASTVGGASVVGSVLDASDEGSVRGWVESSIAALGGCDVFVHNTSGKPARKLEGWINNFNVDLMSLVCGVDAAKGALVDGGGVVISIGTTAVVEHFASGSGSYSALKAAVTNWTLGQAQVLGAQGVRCNVVQPGPIFVEGGDWDMIKQNMGAFFEATEAAHPGKAMGQPEDVAWTVAFLASDRARHINGVNLTVDGGFLKRVNW
jgi:NAD(P)-dependent dehydrogenase (short-subunit alcohol dehydrogenase family)